ncbi:hypothetical protein [Deinococcus humi]|uniref:Uncharacterized protein n=1 Tax=Deinococcus humi TaxID=662880 RepID=A0A7W8NFQ1_9DEIO|nr:hypothetical protein [Deinococcus humi]MBB5362983.1 hypothetical protein [Deinococcus humi]
MSTAGPRPWSRAGANAIAHVLRAWWCATLGRPLTFWATPSVHAPAPMSQLLHLPL